MTSARGNSSRRRVRTASDAIKSEPEVATITGSTTMSLRLVKAETLGDRLNERGRGHHADLDGAGADVGEDGVYLLGQKFGADLEDAGYTGGVLGRQGSDALMAKTPFMVMALRSA